MVKLLRGGLALAGSSVFWMTASISPSSATTTATDAVVVPPGVTAGSLSSTGRPGSSPSN